MGDGPRSEGSLDALARELASGTISRRTALKRLGGVAGLTLFASAGEVLGAGIAAARGCPKGRVKCKDKCCPKHAKCHGGKCKCKEGFKRCGKKCVKLDSDPRHCGKCKNNCRHNDVGHACVDGTCGCEQASDCPKPLACDKDTNTCTESCFPGADECHDGCCSQTNPGEGVCRPGTENAACGTGATGQACESCAGNSAGPVCLPSRRCGCGIDDDCDGSSLGPRCRPNGRCGCNDEIDCPDDMPCINGVCGCNDDSDCPGTQPCLGFTRTCGCGSEVDCPANQACNGATGECVTGCSNSTTLFCNGGCCSGPNGACLPGTASGACGSDDFCINCTSSASGHACIPEGGGRCGCNSGSDCPAAHPTCNQVTKLCE